MTSYRSIAVSNVNIEQTIVQLYAYVYIIKDLARHV